MTDWYSYPTNYSGGREIDGVYDFFWHYPTSIIGSGYYGLGIIMLIFVSTFGISMVAGSRKALLTASFISFIFSVFLWQRGILTIVVPFVLVILMIIGAIGSKDEGGSL